VDKLLATLSLNHHRRFLPDSVSHFITINLDCAIPMTAILNHSIAAEPRALHPM
jgi:hypothetical protein